MLSAPGPDDRWGSVAGVPPTSPVARANAGRNARGDRARHARWAPAREAAWALLERNAGTGSRVAVVGAGNGDTLPLRRLAARAAQLDLVDLDPAALRRARRRCGLGGRRSVGLLAGDVTAGRADAVVARALARPLRTGIRSAEVGGSIHASPLTGRAYDLVVADCLYTQLIYPALADSSLDGRAIDRVLLEHGQRLTNALVADLHAAAPGGVVVHLHDVLGWWEGRRQPFALDDVLARAATDTGAALRMVARGSRPYGCDVRAALGRIGAEIVETAFWRWPFGGGVDYLVCATVAKVDRVSARRIVRSEEGGR